MSTATLAQPAAPLAGGLEVSVSAEGATTVVALQGEADVATLPALTDAFARIIAAGEGDVVVDLARLEFLDTATIRAVVRARAVLAGDGRQLTLRSPSRIAGRVLAVFGLTQLVTLAAPAGR